MDSSVRGCVIRLSDAETRIPGPEGERSALVLKRGTLDGRLSMPVPPNVQTPHQQDEIYVVIKGSGTLVHDGAAEPFEAGDILFVAAGTEHHYQDFAQDTALWRIFYGAQGGELAKPA